MFNSWRALSYFLSGISNVAFFFSAICTQEKKKGSIQESEDESDSSNEEFESSQVPSSTSQQWLDGNLASVNKALCPAIAYWRVSMGLTVRRKTAKNLAVRRKNERILPVSRKKN